MTPSVVDRVWARLASARHLTFRACWEDAGGWGGAATGRGSVRVERSTDLRGDRLLIREEGVWEPEPGRSLVFSGGYRWTREEGVLRLEHLRMGRDRPLFLAELRPAEGDALSSRRPHVCGSDRYRVLVRLEGSGVSVVWRVRGPRKHQILESEYR